MNQEEPCPRAGDPRPRREPDTGEPPEATAGARDPWRYMAAVYPLNRGLPHLVDFPEALV